jgi:hypothetical protein
LNEWGELDGLLLHLHLSRFCLGGIEKTCDQLNDAFAVILNGTEGLRVFFAVLPSFNASGYRVRTKHYDAQGIFYVVGQGRYKLALELLRLLRTFRPFLLLFHLDSKVAIE